MSFDAPHGIGARLLQARKKIGISRDRLGELIGVSGDTVRGWEIERIKLWRNRDAIQKLAQVLDLAPGWLLHGAVAEQRTSYQPQPGFAPPAPYADGVDHPKVGRRLFPVLGLIGAAEFPAAIGDQDPDDFEEFSDDLYTDQVVRYFVRVVGDSMEDTWESGDLALIHPAPTFRAPGYYVAVRGDAGILLKILIFADGVAYLVPENPRYRVERIDSEDWAMIGYVVGQKRIYGPRRYIEHGDHTGLRPHRKVLDQATARLEELLR